MHISISMTELFLSQIHEKGFQNVKPVIQVTWSHFYLEECDFDINMFFHSNL